MQARLFFVSNAHAFKNALRLRPGNVMKSRQGSGRKDGHETSSPMLLIPQNARAAGCKTKNLRNTRKLWMYYTWSAWRGRLRP